MMTRPGSLRPGVFTEYTVAPRSHSGQGMKVGGLVVRRAGGPMEPVFITGMSQAREQFAAEGDQLLLAELGQMLQSGTGGVWCRPVGPAPVEADYRAAWSELGEQERLDVVCCDCQGAALGQAFRDWVVERSGKGRECLGVMGAREPAEARSVARVLNSERMLVCCGAGVYEGGTAPGLLAAALSGLILGMGSPMDNLNGASLPGEMALAQRLEEEQVETLLAAGAIPFETVAGRVECIRAVTSRTTTDGAPDATYRSVNTTLILDHVLGGLRAALKERLRTGRGSLRTRESILSQVMVELAADQEQGLLEQYDPPTAYAHPDDPGLCVVELGFTIAQTVGQILVSAQVQI